MEQLELRWHGHACFELACKGFTVVFDPYEDNYVPGFGALDVAADLVLCSYTQHNDHNAAHVVRPLEGHENPLAIRSEKKRMQPVTMRAQPTKMVLL